MITRVQAARQNGIADQCKQIDTERARRKIRPIKAAARRKRHAQIFVAASVPRPLGPRGGPAGNPCVGDTRWHGNVTVALCQVGVAGKDKGVTCFLQDVKRSRQLRQADRLLLLFRFQMRRCHNYMFAVPVDAQQVQLSSHARDKRHLFKFEDANIMSKKQQLAIGSAVQSRARSVARRNVRCQQMQ